jgi:hypothetical protein
MCFHSAHKSPHTAALLQSSLPDPNNPSNRIEKTMKLQYLLGTLAAAGALAIAMNPLLVAAEATPAQFSEQPQINALVTIAAAPYKW